MENIYLIEDINGLKYVGRTKKTLNRRFSHHKADKKRNHRCTSKELDLENCSIKCIDIADSPEEASELEEFYINSIDCVNHVKYNFDEKEYLKKYYENNKEYKKEYYEKNKDKIKQKKKKYQKQIYYYQKTWGGEKRYHNNLLEIDPDLFNY